ncbi:pyruvate oxidase, putative [Babesia ovata]|uniref:Pyruvate oxidase, putative n=1 Tax=Babesia ovata TaxID=189622 RepID=A0A2H6KHJ4_9APIC|nr:pyruvate oxidase, putative [Babesia ovata]GBE62466.1 pyruvate oxidase, putative [Babesia ovata]
MTDEWISQTRASELYGLSVSELQRNAAHVIDNSGTAGSDTGNVASKVKRGSNPTVPLTVRLVKNPRGYHLPMRLYKTSELETLRAIKREQEKTSVPTDKCVKKKVIKHSRKKSAPRPAPPVCASNGHTFVPENSTVQKCSVCGQRVEFEDI